MTTTPPTNSSHIPSDRKIVLYPNAISPTPMKPTNTETTPLTAWDLYEETTVSTPTLQSTFASVETPPGQTHIAHHPFPPSK